MLVKRLPRRYVRLKWQIGQFGTVGSEEVEVERPPTPAATVYLDGGPAFLERGGIFAEPLRFRVAKSKH